MSDGRYSTTRPVGREHFPKTPRGFVAIRIVQLILGVACLGIDAYVLSNVLFDGVELTMFTSIATMIACIYYLVVEFGKDAWKGYNYWAVLALDIFLLMFWLISFALDAARVAPFANGWTICDGFECIYYPVEAYMELFACMCAATGLAGIEFALFIVSLSVHSVAMHRHRAAGLHCKAISAFDRDNNDDNNNNAPVGQVTNSANNNNTAANIPLQEKKDHHAPSYVSSVPSPPPQQQQQQATSGYQQSSTTQSLYGAGPPPSVGTPHTANSPYQAPPALAPVGGGGAAGYYEAQQQSGGGGAAYPTTTSHHQHQHQSSFASGPVSIPAPHPGSYEAPGSPGTYA